MQPRGNFMWFHNPAEGTIQIFRTLYPNQLKLVMIFGVYDKNLPTSILQELPNMICDFLTDRKALTLEPEVIERFSDPDRYPVI